LNHRGSHNCSCLYKLRGHNLLGNNLLLQKLRGSLHNSLLHKLRGGLNSGVLCFANVSSLGVAGDNGRSDKFLGLTTNFRLSSNESFSNDCDVCTG